MREQIRPLLRDFENALRDYFAGGMLDESRLREVRIALHAHPDFESVSDVEYGEIVLRAQRAGMASW